MTNLESYEFLCGPNEFDVQRILDKAHDRGWVGVVIEACAKLMEAEDLGPYRKGYITYYSRYDSEGSERSNTCEDVRSTLDDRFTRSGRYQLVLAQKDLVERATSLHVIYYIKETTWKVPR